MVDAGDKRLEEIVLAYCLSDTAHLANGVAVIDRQCFSSYSLFWQIISGYFKKYRVCPTRKIFSDLSSRKPALVEMESLYDRLVTIETEDDFGYFLKRLLEKGLRRRAYFAIEHALDELDKKSSFDVVENLKRRLIYSEATTEKSGDLREIADDAFARYEISRDNPKKGIMTGFNDLDEVAQGFHPSELTVFMSVTGGGKTTTLVNLAYNMASRGHNVLWFSLEVPFEKMELKLHSRAVGLDFRKLRDGRLTKEEEDRYRKGLLKFKDIRGRLHIVDVPRNCTTMFLESKLASFKEQFDVIIIDYLGLMSATQHYSDDWKMWSAIAKELRQLARVYEVPFVTAVQLNRKGAERLKGVKLSDIAGAWGITHHSNLFISIERDMVDKNKIYFNILKANDLPTFSFQMYVNFAETRLGNIEGVAPQLWEGIAEERL